VCNLYHKQQKTSVILINIYTVSSTKLEIRAEQFLLGGAQVERERERAERGGGGGRRWGEMTQTVYVHMICTTESQKHRYFPSSPRRWSMVRNLLSQTKTHGLLLSLNSVISYH
jgi:hypothetical protein